MQTSGCQPLVAYHPPLSAETFSHGPEECLEIGRQKSVTAPLHMYHREGFHEGIWLWRVTHILAPNLATDACDAS